MRAALTLEMYAAQSTLVILIYIGKSLDDDECKKVRNGAPGVQGVLLGCVGEVVKVSSQCSAFRLLGVQLVEHATQARLQHLILRHGVCGCPDCTIKKTVPPLAASGRGSA